ncbi:MAG: hypothetical protein ACREUR_05530 [Nitrosospira sp.]
MYLAIPGGSITAGSFQVPEKKCFLHYAYTLCKQAPRSIIIVNYNPNILSPDKRALLQKRKYGCKSADGRQSAHDFSI